MIKLMIADDHQLVIEGINALLADEPGIQPIGFALDGKSLMEELKTDVPDVILKKLLNMEPNSVVFLQMKQEWLACPIVRQGIGNLRDQFKADRRTLIIVGQELKIPFELTGDVLFLDEQLPTREVIRQTVEATINSVEPPLDIPKKQIDDALSGIKAKVEH